MIIKLLHLLLVTIEKSLDYFFQKKIKSFSKILPYLAIYNEYVKFKPNKKKKRGSVGCVYKLEGIDHYMYDSQQILYSLRETFTTLVQLDDTILKFYSVRIPEERKYLNIPKNKNDLCKKIIEKHYNKKIKSGLKTEHYLFVIQKPIKQVKGIYTNPDYKLMLNQKCKIIENGFSKFKPKILKEKDLSSFLSKITNLDFSEKNIHLKNDETIDENLNGTTYICKHNLDSTIRLNRSNKTEYLRAINFMSYANEFDPNVFEALNCVNAEIIQVHTIDKLHEITGKANIKTRLNFTKNWQLDELNQALEVINQKLQLNETYLAKTLNSILIKSNSEEELNNSCKTVEQYFSQNGYITKSETLANMGTVFSIHPFLESYNPRQRFITLDIAAAILNPTNTSPGAVGPWGEYLHFTSLDGKPYSFSFHKDEKKDSLGHSLVIGASGGGKTTLIQFLFSALMGKVKLLAFDQNKGMQLFTEITKNRYIDFENNEYSINPFSMDQTKENKRFLTEMIKNLIDYSINEDVDILKSIQIAVENTFYQKKKEHRNITQLAKIFPQIKPYNQKISQYTKNEFYGSYFSNEIKPETDNDLIAYDFTSLLRTQDQTEENILGVIISYIIHTFSNKIEKTNNKETLKKFIFVDEAPAYFASEIFTRQLNIMLKQLRKKNCCVAMAVQSSKDFFESKMHSNIENIATFILFPNCGITSELIDTLKLNDTEIAFLEGGSLEKQILIKKRSNTGFSSEIVNIDLNHLNADGENYLDVFSSNQEDLKRYQNNPETYIPHSKLIS